MMTEYSISNCDICELLPTIEPENIIAQNDYWVANLSVQDQSNLGRAYITAKRHIFELDQLTLIEEQSFIIMRNGLLRAIRASFDPLTFNVSCLKNDAFMANPDSMPSEAAHVHWHVVPRYRNQPVNFNREQFHDPAPGLYLPAERTRRPVSRELAIQIVQKIQAFMPA